MTETRRERPTGTGAPNRTIAAVDISLPTGRAYAAPPCRGRGLWLVVVLSCPACGTAHSHRAGEVARLLSGRLVKSCPVTGQLYRLAPVSRRREAVRRG